MNALLDTKEALTSDDAPYQNKKAKEETSGETTPVSSNAVNRTNAVINNEDAAMRSNIPPIQPALQPATLSPNTTLWESIMYEMELEFDVEEPF